MQTVSIRVVPGDSRWYGLQGSQMMHPLKMATFRKSRRRVERCLAKKEPSPTPGQPKRLLVRPSKSQASCLARSNVWGASLSASVVTTSVLVSQCRGRCGGRKLRRCVRSFVQASERANWTTCLREKAVEIPALPPTSDSPTPNLNPDTLSSRIGDLLASCTQPARTTERQPSSPKPYYHQTSSTTNASSQNHNKNRPPWTA